VTILQAAKQKVAECRLMRISKELASDDHRVIKGKGIPSYARYLLHHQLHSPANNNTTASSYVGEKKFTTSINIPFSLERRLHSGYVVYGAHRERGITAAGVVRG